MTAFTAPWSRRLRDALAGLAALLLWCGAAWADPPGRVGRLADLSGNVWLYDTVEQEWITVDRNRPLTTGDRLATDADARAEVQVGSTTLRADGSSEFEFVQLDDAAVRVRLLEGSLAVRVRAPDWAQEIEVSTAEGRFTPLREGHYRIDRVGEASAATAWSGELRFEAADSMLTVDSGRRAEFWSEAGVTHYTWSDPEHDNFAQWAGSEDRRASRSAQYVSPEMTGSEDLDRYGDWTSHDEYGPLWIPYSVPVDWAPYRVGHWTWIVPWGWTWVDAAPWGFAPFHYGRWVKWRGRWAWSPGRFVAHPVFAPALVAWIGGSRFSVGVRIGSRPHVGWVPLGFHDPWFPHFHASPVFIHKVNVTHVRLPRDKVRPPREPIMYTNRGVPGSVTVVPADVLRERRPVANAVVPVDGRLGRELADLRPSHEAPPGPVPRARERGVVTAPAAPPRVMDTRRERAPLAAGRDARGSARMAVPSARPQLPSPGFVPRSGERQADESVRRRFGNAGSPGLTPHQRPSVEGSAAQRRSPPLLREQERAAQPPVPSRPRLREGMPPLPQSVRPVPQAPTVRPVPQGVRPVPPGAAPGQRREPGQREPVLRERPVQRLQPGQRVMQGQRVHPVQGGSVQREAMRPVERPRRVVPPRPVAPPQRVQPVVPHAVVPARPSMGVPAVRRPPAVVQRAQPPAVMPRVQQPAVVQPIRPPTMMRPVGPGGVQRAQPPAVVVPEARGSQRGVRGGFERERMQRVQPSSRPGARQMMN